METGSYVTLEKNAHKLVIRLTQMGRDFLVKENLELSTGELSRGSDEVFCELLEDFFQNGWSWVLPEQVGALTSAPIVSDEISYDDNGDIDHIGVIWWFPEYETRCPVRELIENGEVVFTQG